MKKIAILLPSIRNVGPVRVALDIVEELSKKEHSLYFKIFYLDEKIEISFPCDQEKLTFRNILSLYEFDIIHSHMLRPDLVNALLPLFKGKKISTIHNIVETDLKYSHGLFISKIFTVIWKKIWKRIDFKIVLTKYAKEYYSKKLIIKDDQIFVVNNGVKPIFPPQEYNRHVYSKIQEYRKNGKIILGSVSLFNDRKGLEQVIRLLEKNPQYVFIIIGDGPAKDSLIKLSKDLNVEDRVFFGGFLHNAKEYIYLFDCYVMPSREEGFPLALTEALTTKIVTVCSDIPVFREILDNNSTSYFKLDNINSFNIAVKRSLDNKTQLSNNAFKLYIEKYTRETMALKYYKIYKFSCFPY
ncbi:glycosyltransferase family 4 protein [Xenorhabdus bovienii]|uniref:WbzI n=1 Tax=Xenorhabdus bovienii str. kraussei Becker Underwood TaxID=1398204 RepID=A0A077PYC6_XENBV|nr:glycosyltransferase family 4 protein [Xenorhabdus bovienii]CDH25632.1 WbzI [Xenorhabdus bovienii str. kraussei Becker Underwood]